MVGFVFARVDSVLRRAIERWPQEPVKKDAEAGLGSKRDDELSRVPVQEAQEEDEEEGER